MRKIFSIILATIFILTAAEICFAKSAAEQRAEVDKLHDQTLQRLYQNAP